MQRDDRGYIDLMAYLFPPIDGVSWQSRCYRAAALVTAPAPPAHRTPVARRGDVWEPVVRHVAEALCTLESTGADGTDAYLRLRAKAEIVGPWSETLLRLIGEAPFRAPAHQLA